MYVSQVGPPAQIHLTEQFVIRCFLYEVVDVSLYREWQTQHLVPALNDSLQTLLDVTDVGFSLTEQGREDETRQLGSNQSWDLWKTDAALNACEQNPRVAHTFSLTISPVSLAWVLQRPLPCLLHSTSGSWRKVFSTLWEKLSADILKLKTFERRDNSYIHFATQI